MLKKIMMIVGMAWFIGLIFVSPGRAGENLITVNGELISADLNNADIPAVLREIETKTGVKITVGSYQRRIFYN